MKNSADTKLEIGVLYGLRAVMVLMVAAYHIYQQSWLSHRFTLGDWTVNATPFVYGGFLFVDGLMLLTGFLLFLPHAREREEGIPAPGTGEFYFRRVRRILPCYEGAVLLSFLFAVCRGSYTDWGKAVKDLLLHMTFLQTLTAESYLFSPINGALWTVAVEVAFYLVFPLVARCAKSKPVPTLLLMVTLGWGWRLGISSQEDTAMLVNQFPGFLDVYALGMLGAMVYCRFRRYPEKNGWKGLAVLVCLGLSAGAVVLCVRQSGHATSFEAVRKYQLHMRFPFAALMLGVMLSAAAAPRWFRFLLDNRLTRFFSGISMNFYFWHQWIAVNLKQRFFPDGETLHASPDQQKLYTLLCYLAAFGAAMAFTYGLEKPAARLLTRLRHSPKTTAGEKPLD